MMFPPEKVTDFGQATEASFYKPATGVPRDPQARNLLREAA
jgi:hypothetical protein